MALAVKDIAIRECTTVDELSECVALQKEVFALPDLEISPVRHLIVTRSAGGFTLGAFMDNKLIGFVLSVPAYLRGERAFYSHMTAVKASFQGSGIGARLKWAQRDRSLAAGVKFVKWTFEPVKARNAHFNLEKLGAVVREYQENFYGIDYATAPNFRIGLESDRLYAEWELECEKVGSLSEGEEYAATQTPVATIVIPTDWNSLVATDPQAAHAEQLRIRAEFKSAFSRGMICRAFERSDTSPKYLLYQD